MAYKHGCTQATYELVRMQDAHMLDHSQEVCYPGCLWEDCKLVCLPVDCEAGVGLWGQSVYGRWALGRLWYIGMRVVHRRAVRELASFEPGGLLVYSSQPD